MITNSFTNLDSPIYGNDLNQKMVWTESEMKLFTSISNSYTDYIVSDLQTFRRPFETYLKRDKIAAYQTTPEGDLNWEYMGDKLLIWRKSSLDTSVQVGGYRSPSMILGVDFKRYLDNNYSNIYDTGEAKAYLGIIR